MTPHCYAFRRAKLGRPLTPFLSSHSVHQQILFNLHSSYRNHPLITWTCSESLSPVLLIVTIHWSPCFYLCPLLQNTQREAIWKKLYYLTLYSNPADGLHLSKIQSPYDNLQGAVFSDFLCLSTAFSLLSDFHPPWPVCFQITSYP